MRPTEILRQEHRVIERVLDCLEALAARAREESLLDREAAAEATSFLECFADRCHHGKEEERLFPAMLRAGLPRDVGPLPVLLEEHERGRASLRGMKHAVGANEVEDFAAHATAFVELLREHIRKEDAVFFPLADRLLDDAQQAALLQEFERFEHEDVGSGRHEELLAVAGRLWERFGNPGAEPLPRTTFACGHHAPSGHRALELP